MSFSFLKNLFSKKKEEAVVKSSKDKQYKSIGHTPPKVLPTTTHKSTRVDSVDTHSMLYASSLQDGTSCDSSSSSCD